MTAAASDKITRAPQLVLAYDIRRGAENALLAELANMPPVAAALLYDSGPAADEAVFQQAAEILVPQIQAGDAAALIAENSALCGRVKADGLHIEEGGGQSASVLADMRRKYGEKRILGYGNPHNRHNALEAGEYQPDYLFFGKLGKDKTPEPHPRNLALAAWWAEIVQIDCIIQAGGSLASLPACLAAKADFIALEEAIFGAAEPKRALAEAQEIIAAAFSARGTSK